MKPHPLLPLLALLALPMTGAATPDATGHLSAAGIEATGPSTTTADLTALFVRHAPTPTFTLNADRLTIENHHADVTLAVPTPLGSRYSMAGDPDPLHNGPGLLTGHANRPTAVLWVLPLQGHAPPVLTASAADCVTLEPPRKDNVLATAFVNSIEPVWTVNTTGTAAWRTCTDATTTITGDFLFVLWERDALLTANGEARTLRTGHKDAHPGTPLDGTAGTADELFITVRGGNLTLPLAPGAHELYLRSAHIEAEEWRFRDASGTLPVVGAVEGTVRVAGSLAATVTGSGAGAPLGVDVEGQPERVEVDGQSIAVATPGVGTSWIQIATWAALAVVVGVAVLLGHHARWGATGIAASGARGTGDGASASPAATDRTAVEPGRRDVEAERRVLRVVESSPGVTVREVLGRAGVRRDRAQVALDALLARRVVARRGSEARWHIFPAWPDLDERWRREAALRQEKLRVLLGLLHEVPGAAQNRVVALCRERWNWSPSTTKRRLEVLADAGLAEATKSVPATKGVPRGTPLVAWAPAKPTEGN